MAGGTNRPNDGPATTFVGDPMVAPLFTKDDDYFGLVLVAGWPVNQVMNSAYELFQEAVGKCFDKADLESNGVKPPNVYLYPVECLHVTIATLHHVQRKQKGLGEDYYTNLTKKYVDLVKAASQHQKWPRYAIRNDISYSPLNLELESVQLGRNAGILLWKDISGCINDMRMCIQEEAINRNIAIYKIPNIIHSTFLRFGDVPISSGSGEEIQQKFQTSVVPIVHEIFGQVFSRTDVSVWNDSLCKLVCETTPYMHIPDDEDHVLLKI